MWRTRKCRLGHSHDNNFLKITSAEIQRFYRVDNRELILWDASFTSTNFSKTSLVLNQMFTRRKSTNYRLLNSNFFFSISWKCRRWKKFQSTDKTFAVNLCVLRVSFDWKNKRSKIPEEENIVRNGVSSGNIYFILNLFPVIDCFGSKKKKFLCKMSEQKNELRLYNKIMFINKWWW